MSAPGIPSRVRRLRGELDLTQEEFGARLGVSVITIHRWETGQSNPRRLALDRLAEMEAEHAREMASRGRAGQQPTKPMMGTADTLQPPPFLDFNGDPDRISLFVECLRLTRGYQFNPAFASEISRIDPLPHQRIAVYEHMLREDPLRFLLADDAGAGKTIMTGLYVREMLMRGRIGRVLVIPPAGLVGNWERELRNLFRLRFRIVSGADVRSGDPFAGPGTWARTPRTTSCGGCWTIGSSAPRRPSVAARAQPARATSFAAPRRRWSTSRGGRSSANGAATRLATTSRRGRTASARSTTAPPPIS